MVLRPDAAGDKVYIAYGPSTVGTTIIYACHGATVHAQFARVYGVHARLVTLLRSGGGGELPARLAQAGCSSHGP